MKARARSQAWCVAVALLALVALSCKARQGAVENGPDATASPQASAMPAPLWNAPTALANTTRTSTTTNGPAPVPLRGDVALGPDTLGRDTTGYTMSAVLRQANTSGPPRAPEVNLAGLDAARKKTELRLAIELGPTRMRLALLGHGWVLPPETEIRARSDRFGHVVVWPGGATYRPLAPGTLRALVGERRFDVAPVTPAEVVLKEEVGKRIGIRTRKVEVTTRAANATFEIGRLPELGEGGILLCRVLLDLMNALPSSSVCAEGEVPVRAELRWTAHGALGFELTGVLKKADMSTASLLVPPAQSSYAAAPLVAAGVHAALTPSELAAFRTGPVDVPLPQAVDGHGLVVANVTDQLRVLTLDGVPVAWAAPGARDVLPGLTRGRYIAQWRTFLGEVDAPSAQAVPGTSQVGGADAGAR